MVETEPALPLPTTEEEAMATVGAADTVEVEIEADTEEGTAEAAAAAMGTT